MEGEKPDIEETKTLARRKKNKPHHGIPRASFRRLVNEIVQDSIYSDVKWTPRAMAALQESCETMLERRFYRAQRLADLCKVNTLSQEHWEESDPKHVLL